MPGILGFVRYSPQKKHRRLFLPVVLRICINQTGYLRHLSNPLQVSTVQGVSLLLPAVPPGWPLPLLPSPPLPLLHTPISLLEDIIQDLDMVLLMSVNPGFGGQRFIEHSVNKTARLKEMIRAKGLDTLIEVDGGVNLETGKRLLEAGADVLVAGSFVFSSPDPIRTIKELKEM